MNRVSIEYSKAVLMAILAIATAVAIIVGGSAPIYILLPAVLGLLAVYFWWKADVFSKDR